VSGGRTSTLRQLGRDGPAVGAIGFGAMGLSWGYGPGEAEDPSELLARAIAHDITLIDTAGFYGKGENEQAIGRAVAGNRNRVVISTKYRTPPGDLAAIADAAQASLQRLGVEALDLFYPARVDRSIPIEETVGAMAELVAAGHVRHIGLCEAGADTIRRAHAVHPLAAVQTEYSLFTREPEHAILPTLRELGIGLVAYCPLGRGLLTGDLGAGEGLDRSDSRSDIPRFQGENLIRNLALVAVVQELAAERRISPGRLALAWVLHRGDDIVPIPGTRRLAHLEDNLRASEVVLDEQALARLEETFAIGAAAGDRYPPHGMAVVDG
jgi:aryl-alcohol dehydrogenase-like predicted oxidoreductase